MRNRILLAFLALFAATSLFGMAHSAMAFSTPSEVADAVRLEVPTWEFAEGPDLAVIDNISGCSYLTAQAETSIVSPNGSIEAVRLTNTAGTQTKTHSFIVSLGREYTVNEIKVQKVEFDYYHIKKRQQSGKGFPKVQLAYKGAGKGNTQGGGENVNDRSAFIATNLNGNWWHLEYFITALTPTMADHGDSPISGSQKIDGIKIMDDAIYDFESSAAFIVLDNTRLITGLSPRLGMFNRTSSVGAGKYFWFKVAWSGELQSVTMTFDDDTVAEHDTLSAKSPFYIKTLKAGTVVVTATLTIGGGRQTLSISMTLTVT